MVLGCVAMPSFDMELSSCPSPTYGRDFVFSPLYSLACFVSDELNLSVWGLSLDFVSCSLGLYFFFCVCQNHPVFFCFSPFALFFYWSRVALQCCLNFCCRSKCIRHVHAHLSPPSGASLLSYLYLCPIFLTHSSISGYFSWVPVLPSVNSAEVNVGGVVHASFWILFFSRCVLRSWIAASRGSV